MVLAAALCVGADAGAATVGSSSVASLQGRCLTPPPANFGIAAADLAPGQCAVLTPGALIAATDAVGDLWLSNLFISQQAESEADMVSMQANSADAARLWMTDCTLDGPGASGGVAVTGASAYLFGMSPSPRVLSPRAPMECGPTGAHTCRRRCAQCCRCWSARRRCGECCR